MGDVGIVKSTVAGGAGGACLVVVGHPMDTIKVRIQTMTVVPGQPPPYSGTWDCIMKTVNKEGPLGLYKGVFAPLYSITPMYAICFFGYGIGKQIFCREGSYENLELTRIGLAGATSGVFTTPILAPTERVKCVLQTQAAGSTKYKGVMDCARQIYAEGGLRSLNRGYTATMARDSVASFFYFTTYELLKHKLRDENGNVGTLSTLFAGGMAGIFNWLGAIPFDTLKSQLQVAPEGKYPNGIRSVFFQIMRENGYAKGIPQLYRGIVPIMIRAFPANAACFFGYETALSLMNKWF